MAGGPKDSASGHPNGKRRRRREQRQNQDDQVIKNYVDLVIRRNFTTSVYVKYCLSYSSPPVKTRRTKCLLIQGMAEFRYAISFV